MRVIPISLPTPFYIGPVNVYLIAEDPITIIDTGPKTKATVDALRAGLRAAGFLVSDIRRIVLTHAHEDHCGLAKSVRDEAKNAEVFVHDWETGHRHSRLQYDEHRALLERAGVPEKEIQLMRRMYEGMREHYGFTGEQCAFFDFFAADVPEIEEQALAAVQAGLDAHRLDKREAHRCARLFQSYELLFWNTLAETRF